jgi:hypothetical protein
MRAIRTILSRLVLLLGVTSALCVASILGGCAALQGSINDATDVATHFLPTTRTVASFDSLHHVSVTTGNEGQLELQSDASFGELWIDWSARYQQTQGREWFETQWFSSFATLWGRELRLATLNQRTPLDAYPSERARSVIQQEVDSLHQDEVRIDVYLYVSERVSEAFQYTSVRHMSARPFLRINEDMQKYMPKRIETNIVRYTTRSGEGVFYRRNTLIFNRQVEGIGDILSDAKTIKLHIRSSSSPRAHLEFAWQQP